MPVERINGKAMGGVWWAIRDSNPGPLPCEAVPRSISPRKTRPYQSAKTAKNGQIGTICDKDATNFLSSGPQGWSCGARPISSKALPIRDALRHELKVVFEYFDQFLLLRLGGIIIPEVIYGPSSSHSNSADRIGCQSCQGDKPFAGEKTNSYLGGEYLAVLETDNQTSYYLNMKLE
jgi:hypothetical protein